MADSNNELIPIVMEKMREALDMAKDYGDKGDWNGAYHTLRAGCLAQLDATPTSESHTEPVRETDVEWLTAKYNDAIARGDYYRWRRYERILAALRSHTDGERE